MVDFHPLRRHAGTRKSHDRVVRTFCQECTVGCGLLAYVQDNRIVDIQGDEEHPISRGRLCAKGVAFIQGLTHPDRITLPATRTRLRGPFEAIDNWEKGLDVLAERLRRSKDLHGPESLVIGCDPEAGLDFYLGALRFARLWGTPHVYHPLEEPGGTQLQGSSANPVAPCSDWIKSRTLFLLEADLAATHPVAFGWILEAQKQGAEVIAADTRFTATLSKANRPLLINPMSGNLLGLFLMKVFNEENWMSAESISATLPKPQDWVETFRKWSVEDLVEATGQTNEDIAATCRLILDKSPVTFIIGKRLAYQPYSSIWPALVTCLGLHGMQGCGWYPLESGRPQLDSTGDLGEFLSKKAASAPVSYPYQWMRKREAPSPVTHAKAIVCTGNCLNDFLSPFRGEVEDMDLIVYFGSFPNVTRSLSHMVFPVALWPERFDVGFSNDGAIQWGEKIVEPSDACRTGLGFWMRLAQRLGWGDYFPWKKETGLADHRAFYQWLLGRSESTAGCDLDTIVRDRRQLTFCTANRKDVSAVAPDQSPMEQEMLKPAASPADIQGPLEEQMGELYPFYFQATRIVSLSTDASRFWPWTRELQGEDLVQIHPETAESLGIENGDEVIVSGPVESMEGRAWLTRMVPKDMVWALRRLGDSRVALCRKM